MPEFSRNGAVLHYELEGSGIPVVYIAGYGAHSNDLFATAFRQALKDRFQVLVVDNRGAGQTRITAPDVSVNIETMADDIAALLDHLNLKQVHVLGISMGGCIAMTLALRYPEKIKSQVIAVSLAAFSEPNRAQFLLETRREMLDSAVPRTIINRFAAVMLLGESTFQYEGIINAFINAPLDPYEQTSEGFDLQGDAFDGYDIRSMLPATTTPTLVMSSPEDVLVPSHYQDEIANLIPGAEIKRYPGGHIFFMLPLYSQQFTEDVVSFWLAQEQKLGV